MGARTHAQIRDIAETILEDTTNIIFTEAVLADIIQEALSEVSQFQPNEVKHILNVFNGSKELDLSTITGINYLDKIEYPVAQSPRVFRNGKYWGDVVELDIDTAPSASSLGDLTGTVTFTGSSTAITGVSTLFTTELEEGWYIKKSTSATWHRIASITSDTALVLATEVATADNGADTAGATDYWYKYAYLYCEKVHYLSTLTDLVGAIDLVAGYEAGAMLIHIDGLQSSGTLPKNTVLTIAGVSGSYRVTEDATIATNECDVKISPKLTGNVSNNAVVTIRSSSLTSELERILPELVAGRAALNWIGDARTQIDSSVTTIGTGNTQIGLITARATQAVADIATTRTAAIASLATAKAAIALGNTAVGLIAAQITTSKADITSARTAVNVNLTATGTAITAAKTAFDLMVARMTQIVGTDIPAARAAVTANLAKITTAGTGALALLKARLDAMATAIAYMVDVTKGIGLYTGVNKTAETAIEAANAQLVLAIADLIVMQTDITDNDAAFDAAMTDIDTNLDLSITAIANSKTTINTITVGADPESKYLNSALAGVSIARARAEEAMARATEKNDYAQLTLAELQLARVELMEAQAYQALEGAIVRENAQAVSSYAQAAQGYALETNEWLRTDAQQVAGHSQVFRGELATISAYTTQGSAKIREANAYIQEDAQQVSSYGRVSQLDLAVVTALLSEAGGYYREASAYVQADAQTVANYGRVFGGELAAIAAYGRQSDGYTNQAMARLRVTGALNSMQRWAENKIAQAQADLRRLRKPRQRNYNYPTS